MKTAWIETEKAYNHIKYHGKINLDKIRSDQRLEKSKKSNNVHICG